MKYVSQGSGSGKLILFGEHAVVYGQPAIAAGLASGAHAFIELDESASAPVLDLSRSPENSSFSAHSKIAQARIDEAFQAIVDIFGLQHRGLRIRVRFELPVGAGLGSSAAMAVAIARACAQFLSLESPQAQAIIEQAVRASESIFHGNASGIDQTAAMGGGMFVFQRHGTGSPEISYLAVPPITVVVCKPGESSSTAKMVEHVAWLAEQDQAFVHQINQQIGDLTRWASSALEQGNWQEVGRLMNLNHQLLRKLGVSTREIDAACEMARKVGAFGAKLTGAGGGGCLIAMAPACSDRVLDAWRQQGWQCFLVKLDTPDRITAAV